jgi:hypothetical protein
MKIKKLPKSIQNNIIASLLQSKTGIILSYWMFQGILYMDNREIIFKITIDILLLMIFYYAGIPFILAIFFAHTVNMFINGHVIAMRRHMGLGKTSPDNFIGNIEKLHERLQRQRFLLGAAAYGSLSKNLFKATSDIDIRVFPRQGRLNWLKAVFWVFTQRFRALINIFPLDIYAFDLDNIDAKMKADEPPIIFYDPQGELAGKYRHHIQFGDFLHDFKAKYLHGAGAG